MARPIEPPVVLLVHAHPDDEALATGATIAYAADRGAQVHVITCTRGEEGTVADPELAWLMEDRDGALAEYRAAEAEQACRLLGAQHHWITNPPYRDSGRAGNPSSTHPRAFAAADPQLAAEPLAAMIKSLRPDVVITYDPNGGYGHPDHIQAHRVTMAALDQAADSHVPERVYWCAVPQSALTQALIALAADQQASGDDRYEVDTDPAHYPDGSHPDAAIAVRIDLGPYRELKQQALAGYRSQVTMLEPDLFRLPKGRGYRLLPAEWYISAPTESPADGAAARTREGQAADPATTLLPDGRV